MHFGSAAFVRILGVVFPLGIAVEALGPIMAGAIYDLAGTYAAAFVAVAAFCAAGLAYSISVRRS